MDISFKKHTVCIRGNLLDLSEPKVMGILNCTPDSFYDGGRYSGREEIVSHVTGMIEEGADIIDIGAVSTRPGSVPVDEDEELKRLSEVMGIVRDKFPDLLVSIDTWRSGIAKRMVADFGADMINDISSGEMDSKMPETIAELQVPYIAMHMKGTPLTMQDNPEYDDVVDDILRYFAGRVRSLRRVGIKDIIIDPGFGFGKTLKHNYILAGRLEEFGMLELPVLVGFSRKSMVYNLLGSTPDEALAGTVVLNTVALMKGVNILRVHDVREAKDVIQIVSELKRFNNVLM